MNPVFRLAIALVTLIAFASPWSISRESARHFTVILDQGLVDHPATGRVFVLISRQTSGEPRLVDTSAWYNNTPDSPSAVPVMFATDTANFAAGGAVDITIDDVGFPVASLRSIPTGDYTVQALFNVYTRFERADGHVLWAHKDRGEGQHAFSSPGNLVSEPMRGLPVGEWRRTSNAQQRLSLRRAELGYFLYMGCLRA
jgi:hypothetical protein